MIINRMNIGAHGKHTVYAICNECLEGRTEELCRFDTLEAAATVLRFIRGDAMTREQIADAIQAIRNVDGKEGS